MTLRRHPPAMTTATSTAMKPWPITVITAFALAAITVATKASRPTPPAHGR